MTKKTLLTQMVQVSVCGVGELESAEADVVQSLIVNAERLVSVLNELMHGEGGVVRLHHRVRHLNNAINSENTVNSRMR